MARKDRKDRGLVERPKGSGIWWVRMYFQGKEKCFKVGAKSVARAFYEKLKTEECEHRLFPEKYRNRPVPFSELAKERIIYADAHHKRMGDDTPRAEGWHEAFEDMDASAITSSMIEKVLLLMKGEGYADATICRYLVVLKAIFNRAIRDGLFSINPAAKVKAPKVNNCIVRYLTPEQEDRLMEELPERLKPVITIALHTGMRQGKILKLKWDDLDFNVGVITIHQTKAGESRRVLMNSIVWKVLVELQSQDRGPWVFCSSSGTALDGRNLRKDFDKAIKRAGLAPFRFHDLRHTFASRLAMQGANDRTLQELLGHKTPRMVLRYAHLSPTHLWQTIEGLTKIRPIKGQNSGLTVTKTVTDVGFAKEEISQPIEKTGAGNGI